MTSAPDDPAKEPSGSLGRIASWLPSVVARLRRDPPPETVSVVLLSVASIGIVLGATLWSRNAFPPSLLAVVMLFGGLMISRRAMLQLALVVAVCLTYYLVDIVATTSSRPFGVLFVVGLTGLIAYEFSRSRDETGMAGMRADSMLVELRKRLEATGRISGLPAQWHAESVIKPAGGGPFAGDFVVTDQEHDRLEIVLVDVSGKGVEAGTRALLLSGALGGLLGTKDYLAAANSYLVRQDWDEGFATALHLVLDLESGSYELASAGHPPVAHFDAGSGRWSLLTAHGPALGLMVGSTYETCSGTLRPGDAVLLYTDGLVEVPGRDLDVGIDKLLGEAERLVTRGFAGGGEVLVNRVSAGSTDDRGLVLLWRSAHS
jgi:hypothetical protein